MEHEWHMVYGQSGEPGVVQSVAEWECVREGGCRAKVVSVGGRPKRVLVPGPDRGLPMPGPAAPSTCEEVRDVVAVWEVMAI